MAKAILVLPEIPDDCEKCRLRVEDCFGGYFCSGTAFDEESYKKSYIKLNGKPDWCPLRPMPEEMPYVGELFKDVKILGWNEAIEAIEGSEEDEATNSEEQVYG